MIEELTDARVFEHDVGRQHDTFPNFASDLLNRVNLVESNSWL